MKDKELRTELRRIGILDSNWPGPMSSLSVFASTLGDRIKQLQNQMIEQDQSIDRLQDMMGALADHLGVELRPSIEPNGDPYDWKAVAKKEKK